MTCSVSTRNVTNYRAFPPLHLSSSVRWYRIGTGQLPHDLIASAWYSEDITRDVCCVRQRGILFWKFKLHLLQHKWCASLTRGAGLCLLSDYVRHCESGLMISLPMLPCH